MHSNGSSRKLNIVIMGPPGSGKSTLGLALGSDYVHISTGDLIREEIAKGTDLGKKLKSDVEKGVLVAGVTASMLVIKRLTHPDASARGFIIDGYPRTIGQVNFLRTSGIHVDIVIVLHCDKTSLVRRISNRRIDPRTKKIYSLDDLPADVNRNDLKQRTDDEESVVLARYEQYKKTEQNILHAFRYLAKMENYCVHEHSPAHIVHINAEQSKADIVKQCQEQIAYFREMRRLNTVQGLGIIMSKL